jgi:D-beta-D-heptose 7-phosphate kinase/D-beta-D-heptose 1-phosphate adenosyltransferase
MVCAERDGASWYLAADHTEVRDVCGAGDTVLAALGAVVLDGGTLREACRFARIAAGRQVASLGISSRIGLSLPHDADGTFFLGHTR